MCTLVLYVNTRLLPLSCIVIFDNFFDRFSMTLEILLYRFGATKNMSRECCGIIRNSSNAFSKASLIVTQ